LSDDRSADDTSETGARTDFYDAVRSRDHERIRALAAANPRLVFSIDPHHCCGATAMNTAVMFGDPDLLDTLLDLGADPNQPSDWRPGPFQALHSIPHRYLDDIGPFLIERGAALDAYSAAKLGLVEELRALVETDPDVIRRKGPDGQRPLHFSRTPEVAAYLLDMGADIEARCVDHESTAAEWAATERPDVCRYLLDRGARGDEFMYVMIGDLDRLAAAIDADPNVLHARMTPERFRPTEDEAAHIYMYSVGTNCTLLHAAANLGRLEVATYLLERGVDPDLRGGYDDQTAAHGAAWNNHADVIRALAAAGANIDLPSGAIHRNTPLGWAVLPASLEAIDALLDAGAAIRDHYVPDAEHGMTGGFREFSTAPPERFEAIRDLLLKRSSA
jgi:ankyrin repeat protein